MSNPLLEQGELPDFSAFRADHVKPAITQIISDNLQQLEALTQAQDSPDWQRVAEPVALMSNRLARAWSQVSHLNSVMNSDELRAVYTETLGSLSDYYTEVGQNRQLFEAYQGIADAAEDKRATLSTAQRKVIDDALRDFRLSGVDLAPEKKNRYREISQELSSLSSDFANRVLDATQAWSKHIDSEEPLAGLPPSAMDLARQNAQQRSVEGFVLTLDFPCYLPVMTYAEDERLRREVYTAFSTRASDEGPQAGRFDNSENMRRILALRHEQAQLLGFANYAEQSLATKMARSSDEVLGFLDDLAERAHDQAARELQELEAFVAREFGKETLEPWDIPFYSEKYRQQLHNISEEEVKPYFPVPRVIAGMFEVVSRLFNVTFHPVEGVDVYHPDVTFYEIRDPDGSVRAQFYFDLYARQNKRGGAWMDICQSRLLATTLEQMPVAYMVCNFTPPVGGKAAQLTHREVETLFHEFGHGLHHMLTRVDHLEVAGINGVAWDAVELPSQFMENYCWEREALDLFAAHVDTGEKIPDDLFSRMLAARNFQSGMQMVRQLEFSLFDFRMHLEYDPARGDQIYRILEDVRKQVAVIEAPSWNRFPHGFSHVFDGGYAAGYYSYMWAEVLSADAFSLFEEEGVFHAGTGTRFLENILEKGGSREAMDLFVAFRGREPTVDALLRHSGIGRDAA